MIKLLCSCILFFSISLNAQVGGEEVYQFLNLSSSARQIALGGEVVTLLDDVNQPIWNPAVINNQIENKISVNYTNYLAGINIGSIAYANSFSRNLGTFHGSIQYLDYGTLIGADEEGNEIGDFGASDIAISLGYAYNLPKTNFFIGTNLRVINSSIANFTSTAITGDFAILYNNPLKAFVITLVARNFGKQLTTYNGIKEKLPFRVSLGGAYQLDHVPLKWYFTLNNLQKWNVSVANPSDQTTDLEGNVTEDHIGFIENSFRHFVVGAELFPKSAVNLRLGYNFRRAAELKLQNVRTFSGFSFGFGIKMKKIKFNYAYSKFHSADNVSTFSLQMDIGSVRNY